MADATINALSFTNRPAVSSFGSHAIWRVFDISADATGAASDATVDVFKLPVGARVVDAYVMVGKNLAANCNLVLSVHDGDTTEYEIVTSVNADTAGLYRADSLEHFMITYCDDPDWRIRLTFDTAGPGTLAAGDLVVAVVYTLDAEAGEFQPHASSRTP